MRDGSLLYLEKGQVTSNFTWFLFIHVEIHFLLRKTKTRMRICPLADQ